MHNNNFYNLIICCLRVIVGQTLQNVISAKITASVIPLCDVTEGPSMRIINGRKWRMKLLHGSDNHSFLSGSTNISDDDSVSDTSISAEFEVAPVSFCA